MTAAYQQLASQLEQRINIIGDSELRENNPQEQLKQLQTVSESIIEWHKEHRTQIPTRLNHFLQQSSLSKALDYLKSEGLI